MFNFKKNKKIEVVAPVTGKCVPLEVVPDKLFSEKLLGDGCAYIYEDEFVCAPITGIVTMIAQTKHAFGVTAKNGLEVLTHIGLDTVELKGEGFQVLVSEGQKITAGQPIIKIDRRYMEKMNSI
uniref:PTS sugar transporter subunit IIA n=1 Tax=Candidatus Enterococcus willemsii TaxID=1857215 RepID=UPI00403F0DE7